MDLETYAQVVPAVIIGTALSFAFFMGALRASRDQSRDGKSDDELTRWVYPGLIAAPLVLLIAPQYIL